MVKKVKDKTQYNLKDDMPEYKEDVILIEFHEFEQNRADGKIPVFVRWYRRDSELFAKVKIKPVSLKFTLIKHKEKPELDKETFIQRMQSLGYGLKQNKVPEPTLYNII